MILIDGKKTSEEIQSEIAAEVAAIKSSGGKVPHLAAVLVGNNPASETYGKHCVVLGRSNIVGLPVSILLERNSNPGNCTVTVCHSKTKNIEEIAHRADILIAAIGQPEFVTAAMVKNGAVVIDVGITR